MKDRKQNQIAVSLAFQLLPAVSVGRWVGALRAKKFLHLRIQRFFFFSSLFSNDNPALQLYSELGSSDFAV